MESATSHQDNTLDTVLAPSILPAPDGDFIILTSSIRTMEKPRQYLSRNHGRSGFKVCGLT